MTVTMRVLQRFRIGDEREFMRLEHLFAELERRRPDFPKGRRLKPISASEPVNTLVWESDFATLDDARKALAFLSGDAEHEALLKQQLPLFEQVRVEFYERLD
jgi:hypothetical protein